jgi:hypothetical protein
LTRFFDVFSTIFLMIFLIKKHPVFDPENTPKPGVWDPQKRVPGTPKNCLPGTPENTPPGPPGRGGIPPTPKTLDRETPRKPILRKNLSQSHILPGGFLKNPYPPLTPCILKGNLNILMVTFRTPFSGGLGPPNRPSGTPQTGGFGTPFSTPKPRSPGPCFRPPKTSFF